MAIDLIIYGKINQDVFEDQRVAVLQQALLQVGAQIGQWNEMLAQHQIATLQTGQGQRPTGHCFYDGPRTRSDFRNGKRDRLLQRPHLGLMAFSDHGLDHVPAGRNFHVCLGSEPTTEHGAVAGIAQIELYPLLRTFHVLVVPIVKRHHQMDQIPASFSFISKAYPPDLDVGQDD